MTTQCVRQKHSHWSWNRELIWEFAEKAAKGGLDEHEWRNLRDVIPQDIDGC